MKNNYYYNVFVNCPFDEEYSDLFKSIIFTVQDCGFIARCSLEIDDSGKTRIDKIAELISECKFGIHDLSRTEIDKKYSLPRFNMPFELGLFLGAQKYGHQRNRQKVCLILDKEQYRFQKFISDISGQDPKSHKNNSRELINQVRDWLSNNKKSKNIIIPGGSHIYLRYKAFKRDLPSLCKKLKLSKNELVFNDYIKLINIWIKINNDL